MRSWRWGVVAVGAAALLALPTAVAAWPTGGSSEGAATLLARIRTSAATPYSGYAESTGGLALPVTTTQFSSLANLFGDQTRMRVWWRASRDWRVDTVNFSGESDVHQFGTTTWTWDYEANTATSLEAAQPAAIRLPTAGDLLPTDLGRRLLSGATPTEVSRLPVRRIAGHDAPGLRLTPESGDSTVAHVDVWAESRTAVPLRVEVYGRGDSSAVLTSQFLDFSASTPSPSDTSFTPPDGAKLRRSDAPDLAALIDRFGRPVLPGLLAGIARNDSLPTVGAIGVYGRGVTEFAAAPLPRRTAGSLRNQLEKTPGVTIDGDQLSTSIGPLSLVVTSTAEGDTWLLTGTVSTALLVRAAADLPADSGLDR